ncbi:MAG: hypothetical protein QXP39_01790 [Candidatus Aenigmatarchaeota archaeon]
MKNLLIIIMISVVVVASVCLYIYVTNFLFYTDYYTDYIKSIENISNIAREQEKIYIEKIREILGDNNISNENVEEKIENLYEKIKNGEKIYVSEKFYENEKLCMDIYNLTCEDESHNPYCKNLSLYCEIFSVDRTFNMIFFEFWMSQVMHFIGEYKENNFAVNSAKYIFFNFELIYNGIILGAMMHQTKKAIDSCFFQIIAQENITENDKRKCYAAIAYRLENISKNFLNVTYEPLTEIPDCPKYIFIKINEAWKSRLWEQFQKTKNPQIKIIASIELNALNKCNKLVYENLTELPCKPIIVNQNYLFIPAAKLYNCTLQEITNSKNQISNLSFD